MRDHNALEAERIEVVELAGEFTDALQYSLAANAKHGKRREPRDYAKAYRTAVEHKLVTGVDADSVQALLQCSLRTAYELTEPARQKADAERDAQIAAGKAEGKSNRQISRETGIPPRTVDRAVTASKLQTAEMTQGEEGSDVAAIPSAAIAELNDMVSDRGNRWFAAYRALQAICACDSVDDMLADPYRGIQQFDRVLHRAHAWVNELHRRYFDGD